MKVLDAVSWISMIEVAMQAKVSFSSGINIWLMVGLSGIRTGIDHGLCETFMTLRCFCRIIHQDILNIPMCRSEIKAGISDFYLDQAQISDKSFKLYVLKIALEFEQFHGNIPVSVIFVKSRTRFLILR